MSPENFYQHLFADHSRAGVYCMPADPTMDLLAGAHAAGCRTIEIDLGAVHNREALFDTLASKLELPQWFGRNWDALADCLGDLEWLEAKAYVLIFRHCEVLNGSSENDFTTLLDIMNEAARAWHQSGVSFWCLIDAQTGGPAWLHSLPTAEA